MAIRRKKALLFEERSKNFYSFGVRGVATHTPYLQKFFDSFLAPAQVLKRQDKARPGGTKPFPPAPPASIFWDQPLGKNCKVDVAISELAPGGLAGTASSHAAFSWCLLLPWQLPFLQKETACFP
jgi:hypothetical protein